MGRLGKGGGRGVGKGRVWDRRGGGKVGGRIGWGGGRRDRWGMEKGEER